MLGSTLSQVPFWGFWFWNILFAPSFKLSELSPLSAFLFRVTLAPWDDFIGFRRRWENLCGWPGPPPGGEEPSIRYFFIDSCGFLKASFKTNLSLKHCAGASHRSSPSVSAAACLCSMIARSYYFGQLVFKRETVSKNSATLPAALFHRPPEREVVEPVWLQQMEAWSKLWYVDTDMPGIGQI